MKKRKKSAQARKNPVEYQKFKVRPAGAMKPRKGKGSYSRKNKYKDLD